METDNSQNSEPQESNINSTPQTNQGRTGAGNSGNPRKKYKGGRGSKANRQNSNKGNVSGYSSGSRPSDKEQNRKMDERSFVPRATGNFQDSPVDRIDHNTDAFFSPCWFKFKFINPIGSDGSIINSAFRRVHTSLKEMSKVYYNSERPDLPFEIVSEYFYMITQVYSLYIVCCNLDTIDQKFKDGFYKSRDRLELGKFLGMFCSELGMKRTSVKNAIALLGQILSNCYLPKQIIEEVEIAFSPFYIDNFSYTSLEIPLCGIAYCEELIRKDFNYDVFIDSNKELVIFPNDPIIPIFGRDMPNIIKNIALSLDTSISQNGQYYWLHILLGECLPKFRIGESVIYKKDFGQVNRVTKINNINQIVNSIEKPIINNTYCKSYVNEDGKIDSLVGKSYGYIIRYPNGSDTPIPIMANEYTSSDITYKHEVLLNRVYDTTHIYHNERGATFDLNQSELMRLELSYKRKVEDSNEFKYIREPGLVNTHNSRLGLCTVYSPNIYQTVPDLELSNENSLCLSGSFGSKQSLACLHLTYGLIIDTITTEEKENEDSKSSSTIKPKDVDMRNISPSSYIFPETYSEDGEGYMMILSHQILPECVRVSTQLSYYNSLIAHYMDYWFDSEYASRVSKINSGSDSLIPRLRGKSFDVS
jgi:hypothetical protein